MSSIEELLRERPYEFEFFQLVRLLQRLEPDRAPVGGFVRPSKEVARFVANPASAFPASQVQAIEWPDAGPPKVAVNFLGLNGPSGVLPLYYTELVVERMRAKDSTLRSFLDIFNHRAISLFYQAWEKYRFPIAYERGERDRFSHHLLDLIGLGTLGLEDRQDVPDDALLYYAGLLSLQPRSATALRQLLSDYFDVPVEIEQFAGAWQALDFETQCCFDKANTYSEQLGAGAIVGDEIWDQQSGVRVRIGPLNIKQYLDFLPDGTAYGPLKSLTRFFCGGEIDFEIQLVLKREETPACELGQTAEAAPQLGWTSWASSMPLQRDPDDAILRF
ncbi:MAG: type VI secretion system baseplate subunit TssG [Acidobacteriota bacterium]|nr:type VI secretion system baseplate subunit TssG [Acidobacteriota bacterium]